ncbi:MAG: response regulator [Calditrichaceae bacterium]|nr:response regulator [Calditrichaceae bacterium]MBN2707760.1 response regulator [Calditrichaceae bacterium]RQV96394.1 MAG: response regulator [Calditrichota bacterium]
MSVRLFSKILCFLFLQYPIIAQEYLTHKYAVEDGLINSYITDIAQDSLGRMWFATRSGISIYDGLNWISVKSDIQEKFMGFSQMEIDRHNTVWLTTDYLNSGLWKYENNTFYSITIPEHIAVDSITQYPIKDIKIYFSNNDTILAVATKNSGLFLMINSKWRNYNSDNSILDNKVNSLYVDMGKLYICHRNGLAEYTNGEIIPAKITSHSLPNPQIYSIAIEPINPDDTTNTRIWLVGDHWIAKIENKDISIKNIQFNLSNVENRLFTHKICLAPDRSGGLILGNYVRIFHYDNHLDKILTLGMKNNLITEGVTQIFVDREENIWIGSARGISKIPSLAIVNYRQESGLLQDEVSAIAQKKDGSIVFGHNYGLTVLKNDQFVAYEFTNRFSQLPFLSRVLSITPDNYYNVWISANALGLAKMDRYNRILLVYEDKNNTINCSHIDHAGNHWVSTLKGLALYKNGHLNFIANPEAPKQVMRSITEDSSGAIYFSTSGRGVYRYKDQKWKQYKAKTKGNNEVYCVLPDLEENKLLVGTSTGLCHITEDSIKPYHNEFTITNSVFFLKKDRSDNLWIGTDQGVYLWNGNLLRQINVKHGLAGMETNRYAFLEDNTGRIWIGTNKGVSCYRKEYDRYNTVKPLIRLGRLFAGGREVKEEHHTSLKSTENYLTFTFFITSFKDEKNINLHYKLEGFDKQWQWLYRISRNKIDYPNLPPGKYRLLIQAQNNDGIMSDIVSSEWIKINAPIWQTWWFYAFIILFAFLIIYQIVNQHTKKQYTKRLESQIDIRTRQLRASEEKYRTIFEQSQDTVIITTETGKILNINPAGMKMFGFQTWEEVEAIDVATDLYANKEDREKFLETIRQKGFVQDYELSLRKKDGQIITVLLSSSINYDESRDTQIHLSILKDVTERWQLKEKLAQGQKMESIGMLAGGIAHDFNNILGGILGYASLLKLKMKPTNVFYKYVDSIEKSAIRGADLTSQLLVFARRGESQLKPVNMNDVIKETIKILKSTFPKSIELRMNYGKNIPLINADESQLHQILINLCVNARDAIKGKGIISITTKRIFIDSEIAKVYNDGSEGLFVVLEVIDNGIGMKQEIISRIFEPFFTTKEQGKGTGLGLSMIYGFVKSHKGFIDVESNPGKGSVFRIFLPATDAENIYQERGPLLKTEKGKEHILVVDDEFVLRDFLEQALRGYGYVVSLAEDGEKAVQIVKTTKRKIDLIILDMIMPKMDGQEALLKIRELDNDVPVIITSGFSDKAKLEQVGEMRIAGIIQKPFRIDKLLTQIRTILDNLK